MNGDHGDLSVELARKALQGSLIVHRTGHRNNGRRTFHPAFCSDSQQAPSFGDTGLARIEQGNQQQIKFPCSGAGIRWVIGASSPSTVNSARPRSCLFPRSYGCQKPSLLYVKRDPFYMSKWSHSIYKKGSLLTYKMDAVYEARRSGVGAGTSATAYLHDFRFAAPAEKGEHRASLLRHRKNR